MQATIRTALLTGAAALLTLAAGVAGAQAHGLQIIDPATAMILGSDDDSSDLYGTDSTTETLSSAVEAAEDLLGVDDED